MAVPVWFDTAIGYWTGAPDWELVRAALERAVAAWDLVEIALAAESLPAEWHPADWLAAGSTPGVRALLVGNSAAWRLLIEPDGHLRWATAGVGEGMLVAWAASEHLELIREDGAAWR